MQNSNQGGGLKNIPSGISWHAGRRKCIALANAAHAAETQFGIEINVDQALRHEGPVALSYWASGDDDGVNLQFAASGERYWFDEQASMFRRREQ